MTDHPLLLLLMTAVAVYMAKLWRDDWRAARAGQPNPHALPGATSASWRAIGYACAGALALLALETFGEIHLGIAGEQSQMTVLFAVYTLAAPILEELIFRGYLVVDQRGAALRWVAIVGASVIFAAIHPFLWKWEEGGWVWVGGLKGWFSTGAVFLASLWFYTVRFASWNPQRSLLPCFAAHAAKNLGVIGIKAAQGFLVGWW